MVASHPLLIDGRAVAQQINQHTARRAEAFCLARKRPPHLGVVLVGEDSASATYVAQKERQAQQRGIDFTLRRLPASATQHHVAEAIAVFNQDERIDAQLLQLPLPNALSPNALLEAIDPRKDADGLHPHNLGRLLAELPGPKPCTPSGCIALLRALNVELVGQHVVIVGRSRIVGRPLSVLLSALDATVTVCHRQSRALSFHLGHADIVISATGVPHLIRGTMLKAGAIVIDVGISRVDGKLCGDVDTKSALARGCRVTPVPGGVGPMTVAMLMDNVVTLAESRLRASGSQAGLRESR